jgi:putative lipoprotein (rSAM/lipoprotein system)
MQIDNLKVKSKFVFGLVAILGFLSVVSCSLLDEKGYSNIVVYGTVTDPEGLPLEDIEVSIPENQNIDFFTNQSVHTTTTDESGNYAISFEVVGGASFAIDIAATDIDGVKNNGAFQSQTIRIWIDDSDYSGGQGWNEGNARKAVNFILEPKE